MGCRERLNYVTVVQLIGIRSKILTVRTNCFIVFKGLGIKRTMGIIWNFLKGAGNLPSGFLSMFHRNVKTKQTKNTQESLNVILIDWFISLFLPLNIKSNQQLVLFFVSGVFVCVLDTSVSLQVNDLYTVCSPVFLKIMYICKLYRECIYVHKIFCSFVIFFFFMSY